MAANEKGLSHFDAAGNARMVDVSAKPTTLRTAKAEGQIRMAAPTLATIEQGKAGKGDVLAVAQLAGIMAAKHCATLIPLCHSLPLTKVAVSLRCDPALPGVRITAELRSSGQTGVEMEALTAVSVAALTVYDMCKAIDRGMEIGKIRVTFKDGGQSGRYQVP